ncbi:MAG TPA: aminotransferase class I/II-fold pyridoxal phosphate-dependent enzyme [Solirubrobacteraceae bacterium]|nr:aminotransferase class I/II-fold pyridoxal phosphate-dependent enzyme [Solirubrobacteraceae bacterium]
MLELAQYQIVGSTAREIAASAEAAIRDGGLEPGAALPTVRSLAAALGTSPATVNAAYRVLRARGLIVADGRRGTRVAPRPALRTPQPAELPAHVRDLAHGLPDPALLPSLAPVFAGLDFASRMRMSELDSADPELLAAAADAFRADGLPPGAIAVVGGAFDGIERVLQTHLHPGDRIVVEDPAYAGIRDLLPALGLVPVPVPVDELGLIPAALEAALARDVEAALIVPRAQNPYGSALDAERAAVLCGLLTRRPGLLLVEDDHAGVVSGAPFATLVDASRERWAVVRSMSKMLHPDLRLALMTGDETTIARVEGRQALGTRWVSHILQATVAALLSDPGLASTTTRAAAVYRERRHALLDALAARDVPAHGHSGLNVWVPVREEGTMVRALLDAGWFTVAGERFRIETPPGIRITVTGLEEGEADAIASVIAAVEHAGRPRRAY